MWIIPWSRAADRQRSPMKKREYPDSYVDHVEHPRYGKCPRLTDLDLDPESPAVRPHWNTRCISPAVRKEMERLLGCSPTFPDDGTRVIRGTGVAADLSRQAPATVSVTHYFDVEKVCRDCGRRFIFFADEQKYWYEDLRFPLEADAVRCPPCRKRLQNLAQMRQRYEQLIHAPERTLDETFEMAECCMGLIEQDIFHRRQTERVRMLLNQVPDESRSEQRFLTLVARVRSAEGQGEPSDAADSR